MKRQMFAVVVAACATGLTAAAIGFSLQGLVKLLRTVPSVWTPAQVLAFAGLLLFVSCYIVALPVYRLARLWRE